MCKLFKTLFIYFTDVDIELKHGVRALALYYVATEEGGASSSTDSGIPPGTLRAKFLDALQYLQPDEVRFKLNYKAHTEGVNIDLWTIF